MVKPHHSRSEARRTRSSPVITLLILAHLSAATLTAAMNKGPFPDRERTRTRRASWNTEWLAIPASSYLRLGSAEGAMPG